ncbi:unnamed protein product, partial [Ascophyllum nodosum]
CEYIPWCPLRSRACKLLTEGSRYSPVAQSGGARALAPYYAALTGQDSIAGPTRYEQAEPKLARRKMEARTGTGTGDKRGSTCPNIS